MKVERVVDLDSFRKIEKIWNKLLLSSGLDCIFLTHEWFYSWFKCLGEEQKLEVLVFKDKDGQPFGLAPLLRKGKSLCFIASREVTDYCDFISSRDKRVEFYQSFLDYLRTNCPDISRLELINLKSSSPTLIHLPRLAPKHDYSCSWTEAEVSPILELPSSYEKYVETLSRKNRHELRRKLKRLDSLPGVKGGVVTEVENIIPGIEMFINLHKTCSLQKKMFWEKKGMKNFFKEIGSRFSLQKWVVLNFLYAEGRLLAALLNFSYSNRLYFYNVAYNKEYSRFSPGFFLFNLAIKQAILEKKKKADFLRGREKYKYCFGAEESKIYDLTLVSGEKNK
ncbi:GNAT family N-acetyltransferase [Acidobacteriota bacterium]